MTQLLLPAIGWRPFVFSIRPRFIAMFRQGLKLYEFRRGRPRVQAGEVHLIYETAPTSAIVAHATIGEIIEGARDHVWSRAGRRGGITREEFDEYFAKRGKREKPAVAIEMSMEWRAENLPLAGMVAPQSWARWRGPWPLAA